MKSRNLAPFHVPARWLLLLPLMLVAAQAELKGQTAVKGFVPDESVSGLDSTEPLFHVGEGELPLAPADGAAADGRAAEKESSSRETSTASLPIAVVAVPTQEPQKFNLRGAMVQSFTVTSFFELWRAAWDPYIRYLLAHKPFFHDWFASYKDYNMSRWGDGDDFVVNDVGHPLEGAVFARNFLINSPNSQVAIGKNSRYWMSRLKALAWAAAWSTQSEIGPMSETNIGNQGGYTYVPYCGRYLSCLNNPKYPKPPTNNTGWTDFIITPTVGLAWVLGEDTIDKYIVTPIAIKHHIFGGRILRSALEPSRGFAALFAGKLPWMLPQNENDFIASSKPEPVKQATEQPAYYHWEIGTQYTAVNLPVLIPGCTGHGCRQYNSGVGFNFNFNFTRHFGFDSTTSLLPGQGGSKPMLEGLYGIKWGQRWERWGLYGKVRPGFIYYENAMPGGGVYKPTDLTRFAADLGGIVEVYPNRNSTLRVDLGTTLVRYLADHPDRVVDPLGSVLSNQYIVTQGNFQVSTGYVWRF